MNKKLKVASAIVASGMLTMTGLTPVRADDTAPVSDVPAVLNDDVTSEPVPSDVPTVPSDTGVVDAPADTVTPVPSDSGVDVSTDVPVPSDVPTPSDNGSTDVPVPSDTPQTNPSESENTGEQPSDVPSPSDNGSTDKPSENEPSQPSDSGKTDDKPSTDKPNTSGSGQNDNTPIVDNGNGTKTITTPKGGQVTVSTDKTQPSNNPNVTAQQAQQAGASQVGTTSTVTGQVVSNVTPSQPVVLASGQEIVGMQNSVAVLSDGEQKPAEQLEGVTKNSDGTFTAKTADGKKVTLPETGDELLVSAFLSLIGLGFFGSSVLLRKKKVR